MERVNKAIERAMKAYAKLDLQEPEPAAYSPCELAGLRSEAGLPAWSWCRFGHERFEELTHAAGSIKVHARSWRRADGSALYSAPTGVGKTLCLLALAMRLTARLSRPIEDEAAAAFLSGLRFVTSAELVTAAARHPLGSGEPPLIRSAATASLLLLDDLGTERTDRDRILSEVIDRRYMANKPTVVTTNLSERELRERYGASLLRRLTDQGRFITPASVAGRGGGR